MGPKRYSKFQESRGSKTMGNTSIKFEKQPGPDDDEATEKELEHPPRMYDITAQSKFVLKNLRHYTVHPNMSSYSEKSKLRGDCPFPTHTCRAKYYEPLKPSKLQRFLTQKKKKNSFMVKVTEYDQDMTLLLLTNNPPPCSISQEEKVGAPIYFPPEFQLKGYKTIGSLDRKIPNGMLEPGGQSDWMAFRSLKAFDYVTFRNGETLYRRKPNKNDFLPTMSQKKKLRPELKPIFPMKRIGDPTFKGQQWFRPWLSWNLGCGLRDTPTSASQLLGLKKHVSMKSEGETPTSQVLWEPLTFSKLLEEKPTRSVPGESFFRHGRAQQWVVKNAAVIK
ncbi:Testis-specific gene 13 protein [Apodemus speciosus]|uniref:Testis-specific gene 13 protein n=1 Tax=Apodemus speciosus TaxID=105296 RepID=A0ABQ0EV43_APOSI